MNESDNQLVPTNTIRQQGVQLSAAVPVRAQRVSVAATVAPHDHDYYEICIARRGSGIHRSSNGKTAITSGWMTVIPPGPVHAFAQCKQLEVTNVYYLTEWLMGQLRSFWDQDGLIPLFLSPTLFRLPSQTVAEFVLDEHELEVCLHELDGIEEECRRPRPSLLMLGAQLTKCLVTMGRSFVRQSARQPGFGFRTEVRSMLEGIERDIGEGNPFSVSGAAGEIGMSTDHCSRVFQAATGWTPMEYFQRRRAHQAGLLLLNPRLSVTEVANLLGYADGAHLSRAFRRWRGITPRQYRRLYLSSSPESAMTPMQELSDAD